MSMQYEIEAALLAHAAWRKHLRDYLNGRASFDLAMAGASHECDFGKWLDREGHRLVPQQREAEIRAAHEEFHRVVVEILQKIKERRFTEAHADIAADGSLNRASTRLADWLRKSSLFEPVPAAVGKPTKEAASTPSAQEPEMPNALVPHSTQDDSLS